MALSGQINGTVTNKPEYFSYYLLWSATQNSADNSSTITVTSYWATNRAVQTFDTVGTRLSTITINGTTAELRKRFVCNPWDSSKTYLIQSYTQKVSHNADGTKSVVISATADGTAANWGPSSDSSHPCTASATVTLDTIPRAGYITNGVDFSQESTPIIDYVNPYGAEVTSLQAGIAIGASTVASYRDIPLLGTRYEFELSAQEKQAIITACPYGTNTATYLLKTIRNDVVTVNTYTAEVWVEETTALQPTLTVTASAVNTGMPSSLDGLFIQGKSKVGLVNTATAIYGASISSIGTSFENISYSGASVTTTEISGSGTLTILTTATDSRDFSKSVYTSITALPYQKPQLKPLSGRATVELYRSNGTITPAEDGTSIWLNALCSYSPLTASGMQKNALILEFRSKMASSSTWGNWTALYPQNSLYSGIVATGYTNSIAYNIQVRIRDTVGESSVTEFSIPVYKPTFHLGNGGKSIGIGRFADIATDGSFTLDSAWAMFGALGGRIVTSLYDEFTDYNLGITPIKTTSSTTGLPSSYYANSYGFLVKRTSDSMNLYLINAISGTIAFNHFSGDVWEDDWTYIRPTT